MKRSYRAAGAARRSLLRRTGSLDAVAAACLWLAACASGEATQSTLHYAQDGEPAVWPADADAVPPGGVGAQVSPDGTRWVEGTFYALTLHDGATGESMLVAEGAPGQELIPESVVWSPDGRRVAFLQFAVSGYQIRVAGLAGLAAENVELAVGRASSTPGWLDVERLVFSDLDRLFVYGISDGEVRDLGEGRQPVPSPDGARVAFERVSAVARDGCATAVGVGVVNADGSDWRMLLDEAGRFASVVGWSEGGDALLVSSRPIDCNAPEPPPPDRLLRVAVADGAVTTLSTAEGGPWSIGLLVSDPLGDRVAFVEPGCGPPGEQETVQRLVVSSIAKTDAREVVAEAQAAGCAFSSLRWVPPLVERPEID